MCCMSDIQKSCIEATVDTSLLKSGKDFRLEGITLSFTNRIPPNGYVYKSSAGDEAVITLNEKSGNMFGAFKTITGRAFALERCYSGYVWIEFNVRGRRDRRAAGRGRMGGRGGRGGMGGMGEGEVGVLGVGRERQKRKKKRSE